MKIISAIYSSESPVEPGLMLVVPGTVLSEHSFPIGGDNRVKIGAKVVPRVLLEKRLWIAFLKGLECILFFIYAELQTFCECWCGEKKENESENGPNIFHGFGEMGYEVGLVAKCVFGGLVVFIKFSIHSRSISLSTCGEHTLGSNELPTGNLFMNCLILSNIGTDVEKMPLNRALPATARHAGIVHGTNASDILYPVTAAKPDSGNHAKVNQARGGCSGLRNVAASRRQATLGKSKQSSFWQFFLRY